MKEVAKITEKIETKDEIETIVIFIIHKTKINKISETHLFYCIYYLYLLNKSEDRNISCLESIIWDSFYPNPYSEFLKNKMTNSKIIKATKIADTLSGYELIKEGFGIQIKKNYISMLVAMHEHKFFDDFFYLKEKCLKLEEKVYENENY